MTRDEALALADRILALVNSKPTTPSREDLAGLLEWAPECDTSGSMTLTREEIAEAYVNVAFKRDFAKMLDIEWAKCLDGAIFEIGYKDTKRE